ncbi:GMC oxidoreductase [Lysobacter sp. A286]
MIVDFLQPSAPTEVEVDLCVVGAGPAGIAIARSFIGTTVSVCVLEGGGLDGEPDSQALYGGTAVGTVPFDPATCRVRAFGGSGNVWGGGCIPLGAPDLACREWVPHSGWPFPYAELEPHYRQALAYCGIEWHTFRPGSFDTLPARLPPEFDAAKLVNQNFVLSPVFFGETYREALEQAANITVMLHANLLELETREAAGAVRAARIGSLDGRRGVVRARNYVLACGGIENARLLLLSDSVARHGLGNDRDLVGRFFMDHPSGKLGELVADDPDRLCRPYDRTGGKGPAPAFPELCLSDDATRRHRILAGRIRPIAVERRVPAGIQALRGFRAALRHPSRDEALEGQMTACGSESCGPGTPPDLGRLALRLGLGAGDIARAVGRKLVGKPVVHTDHVDVVGFFEQAPNRDSRIVLGPEVDALGQRKVCVDWRLTPLDWHTYRTAANIAGSELARASRGRFRLAPWLEQGSESMPPLRGTSHHLGTTRMSDDPRTGVVDRHCKVHGVDNLYVVGSSVFPAGGWAFPTFTIVALGLRLAEHLRTCAGHEAAGTGFSGATPRPPPRTPAACPVRLDASPARTCARAPADPS